MRNYRKIFAALLALVLCLSLCACRDGQKETNENNSDDKIAEQYDSIIKETEADKPIASDSSVIGTGFSVNDFTFTSADDTIAFSLDKNSFVKLTFGGTFFNYINPGGETVSYEGIYKTAKGLSINTLPSEFISRYAISDKSAVYKKSGEELYYNPSNGSFSGKLTVLYGSTDSLNYAILTDKDVQRFISVWDLKSDGTYINPDEITVLFPDYASIAVLNVTADDLGTVSEISVYKFDK